MTVTARGELALLDADPELGRHLSEEQRRDVRRRLSLPLVELPTAGWDAADLTRSAGPHGPVVGVLVADGGILMHLQLGSRRCSRWLGPGELLLLEGDADEVSVPVRLTWTAVAGTRVVVLDARYLRAAQLWPALARAVYERAARSAHAAFAQQAVSQLPRVADRLLALLWSLADHQGHTVADGVRLRLALTHRELGDMVGARRPTVSLAITQLEAAGLARNDGDDWWLARASLSAFELADEGRGGR